MKKQRLDKIIANSGIGSRKDVKQMIKKGKIKVDGVVIKDASFYVNPLEDEIYINEIKLEYKEYIYIMLNKPQDVISATFDNRHKTVLDLIDEKYSSFNLFPVGRLDIDTEGLLILTNDGKLAHEILSPKKHIPKQYYAIVEGKVIEEDIESFKNRVILDDGYKTLPATLEILKSGEISEVYVTIMEGKFHQVKRMFQAVNKKVKYLKRIKMGKLELDEKIKLGEYRELTDAEIEILKEVDL